VQRERHLFLAKSENAAMPSKEALARDFAAFDLDGNGLLSAEELLKILTRSTSAGAGAPLTLADAQELISLVDANNDGQLSLEEFCELVATDTGEIALLPAPNADAATRNADFEAETRTVKKSSPVLALFERVAAGDAELSSLSLNMGESDNSLNMEFKAWPDTRKAAARAPGRHRTQRRRGARARVGAGARGQQDRGAQPGAQLARRGGTARNRRCAAEQQRAA
jgi:hypothetical protein